MSNGKLLVCRIALVTVVMIVFYGCSQETTVSSRQQPQTVQPKPIYIPDDIATLNTSNLMVINWQRSVEPGGLRSIDGVSVIGAKIKSAYLRPGNHTFEYFEYLSIGTSQSTMTMLTTDKKEFTGEAGKTYFWDDLIKQLDPDALRDPKAARININ